MSISKAAIHSCFAYTHLLLCHALAQLSRIFASVFIDMTYETPKK